MSHTLATVGLAEVRWFTAGPLLNCTTRTWVYNHILNIIYQSLGLVQAIGAIRRSTLLVPSESFRIFRTPIRRSQPHQRTPSEWLDGLGTLTEEAAGLTASTILVRRRTHASQEPRQPFRAGYNPFGFLSFSPSVLPRRVVCISGGLWRGLIPLSCLFETKLLAPEPGRSLTRHNLAEALHVYDVVFFRPQDFEHDICTLVWLG